MISVKALVGARRLGGHGIYIKCGRMELVEHGGIEQIPTHIQEVLDKYEVVFNMPIGLLPRRCRDDAIALNKGTVPTSVRPYKYPLCAKARN